MKRMLHMAAAAVVGLSVTAWADDGVSPESLRRQQLAQEKARVLAGQLVSGVLDIQLRQLAENGLQDRKIYTDIREMREDIDGLVDHEMRQIVDLLVEAQQGTDQQRLAKLQEARAAVRQIVLELMSQRQRLYRRLKIARLAAEVRQLIQRQSSAHQDTGQLSELPLGRRERRALQVGEDQRDVAALYYQLVGLLDEVRTWSGPVGASAVRGVMLLGSAQVDDNLARASQALAAADFDAAQTAQRRVIRALEALLEQVQQTQGLAGADRAAALQLVDQLLQRQELIRQRTQAEDLQQTAARDELEDQQRDVHRDLGELDAALQSARAVDPQPLANARQAALQSVDSLFAGQAAAAASQQSEVIASLTKLKDQLADGLVDQRSQQSSDQLLEAEQRLLAAKRQMQRAAEAQAPAWQLVESDLPQAAGRESEAAQIAEAVTQDLELPPAVVDRAAEAVQAAEQAASQLQQAGRDDDRAPLRRTVLAAERARQRAQTEIEVRLADARRRRLAVEVGELARAAEALEIAAAAERDTAREIQQAQARQGLPPAAAGTLAERQLQVGSVAQDIAAGVKRTAPQASQQLAQSQAPIREAERQLRQLAAAPQAAELTEAARQSAEQAGQNLRQAAAELRRLQGEVADQLAREAGLQLEPVAQTRGEAEQTRADLDKTLQDERRSALQQALQELRAAQNQQLRAAGRTAEADWRQLAAEAGQLAQKQADAGRRAEAFAAGRVSSPLQAVTDQQAVAETADRLARRLEPQPDRQRLARPLRRAASAAAEAANQLLLGSQSQASAARDQAQQALADARQQAQRLADDQAQAPSGPVDGAAQRSVARHAQQAAAGARQADVGSPVLTVLQAAEEASRQAEQAFEQQAGAAQIHAAQQQTAKILSAAEAALQEALQQLESARGQLLGEQARRAQQLAEQAQRIDPAAAAALRQAAQHLTDDWSSQSGSDPPAAGALQRSVAALADREQQIRRDFDIASTLTDLALQQQTAREEIAEQARQLDKLQAQANDDSADPHPLDADAASAQQSAAEALQAASRQFAAAQRATGQGAAQISRQQEVINPPIRRGLQTASQLSIQAQQAARAAAKVAQQAAADSDTPGDADSASAPGDAAADAAPGEPQTGAAQTDQPGRAGDGSSLGQQPGETPVEGLGTGLVPNAPEQTADQIAGSQAVQAAHGALARGAQDSQQSSGGQAQGDQAADAASATPSPSANPDSAGADTAPPGQGDDAPPALQSPPAGDSRAGLDDSDRAIATRRLEGEPWFAKLPPALQKAMTARARRQAPRGYEERLRRYFESVD